jgi:hypothetical protein
MRTEVERGRWPDPRGAETTLGEWCEVVHSLARRLPPTTQDTYRRDLDRYILPRFATYRIGRLPADEIETSLMDEIAGGVAPSSAHRHTARFAASSRSPSRRRTSPSIPAIASSRRGWRRARWSSWAGSRRSSWPRRTRSATAASSTSRSTPGCAGARSSGCAGPASTSATGRCASPSSSSAWPGDRLRQEPKTPRSITISPFTARVLGEHLERFPEPGLDGLVFVNGAGQPLISSSLHTHNYFKPALASAGLACRFHDLRHSSVALAIAEGAHPKVIHTRMGHSSINVTLDRYGHLFPELDEAIATAFGERLAAVQASREAKVVHATFAR